MISGVMLKGVSLCIIILLAVAMGNLYEYVFKCLPKECAESGYVAWGIISEAVLIVILAVKLIKG